MKATASPNIKKINMIQATFERCKNQLSTIIKESA